jgi:hypothetical protein
MLWFDFGKRNKHVIKTKSKRFGENILTSSFFGGKNEGKVECLDIKKNPFRGLKNEDAKKNLYQLEFFCFL